MHLEPQSLDFGLEARGSERGLWTSHRSREPHLGLLSQPSRFKKIPRKVEWTFKFEKLWSRAVVHSLGCPELFLLKSDVLGSGYGLGFRFCLFACF